mmetsp:Transcript_2265/g.8071  ORF Transcript_2265/g.8071 Transcript_2265/m.8071 type:complete len:208 (+) Transcript_2265:1767-2390(+)
MLMCGSSWFPLFTCTNSGCCNFMAKIKSTTSHPFPPRSTKSPLKTYIFFSDGIPHTVNKCNTSSNCPWISPTIITNPSSSSCEYTLHTFGSRENNTVAPLIILIASVMENLSLPCLKSSTTAASASGESFRTSCSWIIGLSIFFFVLFGDAGAVLLLFFSPASLSVLPSVLLLLLPFLVVFFKSFLSSYLFRNFSNKTALWLMRSSS